MEHVHGGNIYEYDQVKDFSANINFRGMPPGVREAALEAVGLSVNYPEPGCAHLRRVLAEREGVLPDEILCTNGAAELIFALAIAVKPGRAVLVQPCFFEYEQALAASGCRISHVMLEERRDFQFPDDFAKRLPHDTKVVILGNPNNPTGGLISKQVLWQILERCQEDGILLVLDESFFDFLSEEDRARTAECASCIGKYPNLVVLKSFTKMYAMPGLRFGYGICSDRELLGKMQGILQPWNVSLPAQMAAEAAAAERSFASETAALIAVNRARMAEKMRELGYRVFDSCANYLLFSGPAGLKEECLRRGFLIRDCSNFRGLGYGEKADASHHRKEEAGADTSSCCREEAGADTSSCCRDEAGADTSSSYREEAAGADASSYYRVCVRSMEENDALLAVLSDVLH